MSHSEAAPPPYAPQDPNVPPSPERRTSPRPSAEQPSNRVSLRGGDLQGTIPQRENDSTVVSPTAYFHDRSFGSEQVPPLIILDTLIHPDIKREELPFPLSAKDGEARDVTQQDWSTFVNWLLTELGSDEIAGDNDKGRRWGNMTPDEFFHAKVKMEKIMNAWNESFFMPRGIHFNAKFSYDSPSELAPSLTGSDLRAQTGIPIVLTRESRAVPPPNHGQPRPRSRSVSSTRSSSSSASATSSLSASSISGADASEVRTAIAAFRRDPNRKSHLKSAVRALHDHLRERAQTLHRNAGPSTRDAKTKANKQAVKAELRGLKEEIRALKRQKKAERDAKKRARKAERDAARRRRRAEKDASRRVQDVERIVVAARRTVS